MSAPEMLPTNPTADCASGAPGLSGLARVPLSAHSQSLLEAAARNSRGSGAWRRRKWAEAKDLLALGQITPPGRMKIEFLDLTEALRALILLQVPVPLRPEDDGRLPVAAFAMLGISYPEDVLLRALPGYAFVQVLAPASPWHPNIGLDHGQPLCLGAQLPIGIRFKELVLLSYGALAMQTVMLDEMDPAGVLNSEAARWWQQNLHRLPLTTTAFLSPAPAAAIRGESR